MALSRLLARPLLASYFLANGVQDLKDAPERAQQVAPLTDALAPAVENATPGSVHVPQDATTWVRISGALQLAAGAALATGKMPRLSAAVLAATLVPSTAGHHRFWEASDPAQRKEQMVHFAKNASLAGGLLIAALDTAGKPGLAWRASHAVHDARREAALLGTKAKAAVG
ncbi:putative membrane protein YphA (DoxX/SURF4 family) [Nocardioides sp. J9]|uniref:DoxX family membrane protein n=1 Tax=unclassified Nocardioides TaxID=2615069 RepID=UPI0004B1780E|nr:MULTISPECIES: DoxX family membrane protein [unclassified Nocardioides]TWH01846.1 putative membrane protein YphA (DoxX/SURF4 family) [Nocardioides sp. J9]